MGAVVDIESRSKRKCFSDFSKETPALEGKKCKIEDILGEEIEITGYRILTSKYPKGDATECLTLQFRLKGETMIVFTGSKVLARQIGQYADEIPFFAQIKRVARYYTFS